MNVSEARAVLRLMGYRLVVWVASRLQNTTEGDGQHFRPFLEDHDGVVYYDVVPDSVPDSWPDFAYMKRSELLRDSKPRYTIYEAKAAFLVWMEQGCPPIRENGA